MRRVHRRKRPIDYLLPFLVLVSVGIIGVMGYQLWSNWGKQGKADVYFYVAEGRTKILPYGGTDWDNAYSGTKLLLGDKLKTLALGRGVVEFFNGTRIRLDFDTAAVLSDLTKEVDRETLVMTLENGSLWINGDKSAGVKESHYEIRTKNMLVKAEGTIFEVESDESQIVRVFDGDIVVDILVKVDGQERVADTISVGVGQEIMIDAAVLKAFEDNESPSVLGAVSDKFKSSSFYKWNIREDKSPTDYSGGGTYPIEDTTVLSEEEATEDEDTTIEDEDVITDEDTTTEEDVTTEDEVTEDETVEESTDEEVDEANNSVVAGDLTAPKVLTYNGGTSSVTTEGTVTVVGEIAGADEVVVSGYILSQFEAGDTTWKYTAKESLGNLDAGENNFEVYGVDADGNKSSIVKFTITYNKPEGTEEDPAADETPTETTPVVDEIPYGF